MNISEEPDGGKLHVRFREGYSKSLALLIRIFMTKGRDLYMSTLQYISEVRVEAAKKLLSAGAKKVSEIAKAVGYKNPDYFCKVFKRVTGESPRDYR